MALSFEAEVEALAAKFARELTEQVTALILRRLGIEKPASRPGPSVHRLAAPSASAAPRAASSPARAPSSRAPEARTRRAQAPAKPTKSAPEQPQRRARSTPEERAATASLVERAVAVEGCVSSGDIERKTGLPPAVIATALKILKSEGRIFMGGTKRFARYATTQAAADKASRAARGGVDPPMEATR